MPVLIYSMIYVGAAVMLFDIIGFILFARKIIRFNSGSKNFFILYVPIILLVLFFAGYLAVGIFGNPDLIVAGILFGGAIFVLIMYLLLERITKKILEKEQLEAKLLAAQESQRAKTAFLSDISHEMRTPLNVILGLDTMALKEKDVSAVNVERLERIRSSAKQLLGLINNVLDMNSIETGQFVFKDEEFSLDEVLIDIRQVSENLAKAKGVEFEYSCDEQAKGYYLGDEDRLKQVILSLLDNAFKFTEVPGKVSLKVGYQDALVFTIADTGIGMDQAFLKKAFHVFAKEDIGVRTGHSGSGLGLAIAKGLAELVGGKIEVESEKGKGSIFCVTLPLKRVEKENVDNVSLENRRILIVEDIEENAEIVADLLELEGALSEHAENGQIAVDMFKNSSLNYYDVILMDLRMPVMDGLTATKEIRSLDRDDAKSIPIIALTANAFESDVRESLDAGMNAHLSKPADSNKLYETIRRYIARKGVRHD